MTLASIWPFAKCLHLMKNGLAVKILNVNSPPCRGQQGPTGSTCAPYPWPGQPYTTGKEKKLEKLSKWWGFNINCKQHQLLIDAFVVMTSIVTRTSSTWSSLEKQGTNICLHLLETNLAFHMEFIIFIPYIIFHYINMAIFLLFSSIFPVFETLEMIRTQK